MKLKVVVHKAEEGGVTGQKSQPFPVVLRRAKISKNVSRICTKLSRAVCRSMFPILKSEPATNCLRSPYEIGFRYGSLQGTGQHGWILLRIHGSHHIYGKTGSVVRISVPVHKNQSLKTGLLRHLLKQAGLAENDV